MSGLDNIGKQLFGASNLADLASQIGDGFFGTNTQKDYSHASKLMRPNGLALAPKQKFLFHTFFNLADPSLLKNRDDKGLVGALVKSAQLPSFTLDTEEYVQYNRKRLVHNRIKYEPVTIVLHDDGEGHVLDMWNNYYQYYFADSQYHYSEGVPGPLEKTGYNNRDIYNPTLIRQSAGWGKTITSGLEDGRKPAFFKDIKIYGFNRGGYVLYTLINPVIVSWQHDTYDYADDAGVMQHTVQIQYEAVKYSDAESVKDTQGDVVVDGFAEPSRYDTEPGALGPGSTTSLTGQGGLIDTASAVGTDLANGNFAGAVQKVGASARTFGSVDNLKNVVTGDAIQSAQSTVLEGLKAPDRLISFPTLGSNKNKNAKATPKKADE